MSTENNIPLLWDDAADSVLLSDMFPEPGYPDTTLVPGEAAFESAFLEPASENRGPVKTESPQTVFQEQDPSYIIHVKVYPDGSSILDAYEQSRPAEKDIVFFCEDTDPAKSNLFGTFLLVKYGSGYRELISNLKQKKTSVASRRKNSLKAVLISTYEDEITDNYDIIKEKYGVDVSRQQVKRAMDGEFEASENSLKSLDDIFGWYNDGVHHVTDAVNGWLEDVKFTREDYQPPAQKPEMSETVASIIEAGSAFLAPIEAFISKTFEAAFDSIKNIAKVALPKSWLAFLERMYDRVKVVLSFFKSGLEAMAGMVGEVLLLGKALLMGFVNGLLSTIQLLVSLIGWIFQNNSNKMINGERWRQMNSAFEFIEDMFDLVSGNISDFFDGIRTLWGDFSIDKIKDALSVFAGKISEYNQYDYAFFTGSFVFEVVLSVILAIFTGGAAAIAKAASMAEKLIATLKLVGREALSVATMGVLDALQMVRMLLKQFIAACKNGWAGFKKFLQELLGDGTEGVVVKARKFQKITREIMRQEMPEDVMTALKKLGHKEDNIIDYFTDYHNTHTNEGFLNDIEALIVMHPDMSKAEIYALFGYTTDYFYFAMNELLRYRQSPHKTKRINELLKAALKKMPRFKGTAYRAIKLDGDKLSKFLSEHAEGEVVTYHDFVSCGSLPEASFQNKKKKRNIFLKIEIKDAAIISDFADGILYRGFPPEELLLAPGCKFLVKKVNVKGDRYLITLIQK